MFNIILSATAILLGVQGLNQTAGAVHAVSIQTDAPVQLNISNTLSFEFGTSNYDAESSIGAAHRGAALYLVSQGIREYSVSSCHLETDQYGHVPCTENVPMGMTTLCLKENCNSRYHDSSRSSTSTRILAVRKVVLSLLLDEEAKSSGLPVITITD